MQHLVHRTVVQRENVGLHLVHEDADVEILLSRCCVERVKDLLHVFVDVSRSIKDATGHEGVAHTLLVDRSAPGLTECQRLALLHLGQNQVAMVLVCGVDDPDPGLIRGQVQVSVRVAFIKVAEVTL